MNISDFLINMAQTSEVEQPELFPFPFGLHLTFCIIAFVFFVFRFASRKQPFQLIMSIAIPFSLVIWLSSSRKLFYIVGLIELIFIITAFITSIIKKTPAAENADTASEDIAVSETAQEENE